MKRFFEWFHHRTGSREIIHDALFENVPGGARWRYVWGSTLTFAFTVQIITGMFLWMSYSPSSQTAWESVYYIQHQMTGGWLLRGIHHFTAQAMTVLLILHLMQVVIDGAYKAPREMNFLFGLGLFVLVLALSLTGYLLPWDQKGYWATKVTTNIMGIAPLMGPFLQKIVIGGPDYGHHTLTRFFALHAGVIPAATAVLIVAHVYLFRRHGLTPKRPLRKADEPFWPEQVLRDAVACLAVLAAVLFLIAKPRLFHDGAVMGAELAAPADPSEAYSAARPEWYFLFLFQFLKYFPGETEIFGAIVIPTLVLFLVALMPILGRWKLGHRFNIFFLGVLLIGAARLTYVALAEDKHNPSYQLAIQEAHKNSERVKELAASGIPRDGALSLLQNDAYTQGPKIFAKNCAGCHRYDGHDGLGGQPKDAPSASDLKDFGSRQWLTGLLDPAHVASTNYFGATKLADGKMVKFVKKTVADFTPEQKTGLATALAALSAEAALSYQSELESAAVAEVEKGRLLIRSEAMRCTECHQFHKPDEDATAPDLTGYASRDWLVAFVSNPADARFYGKRNDRMPAFGKDGKLDRRSIEMVVDWLRRDWAKAHPSVVVK